MNEKGRPLGGSFELAALLSCHSSQIAFCSDDCDPAGDMIENSRTHKSSDCTGVFPRFAMGLRAGNEFNLGALNKLSVMPAFPCGVSSES